MSKILIRKAQGTMGMGTGTDLRIYNPRSESSTMFRHNHEDEDTVTGHEDGRHRDAMTARKKKERKERAAEIKNLKHIPLRTDDIAEEEDEDLQPTKFDRELEPSLMTGTHGNYGAMTSMANQARGPGFAGGHAFAMSEPMEISFQLLKRQMTLPAYDKQHIEDIKDNHSIFIAAKPGNQELPPQELSRLSDAMLERLAGLKEEHGPFTITSATGRAEWDEEPSFMLTDVPESARPHVHRIADEFGQESIGISDAGSEEARFETPDGVVTDEFGGMEFDPDAQYSTDFPTGQRLTFTDWRPPMKKSVLVLKGQEPKDDPRIQRFLSRQKREYKQGEENEIAQTKQLNKLRMELAEKMLDQDGYINMMGFFDKKVPKHPSYRTWGTPLSHNWIERHMFDEEDEDWWRSPTKAEFDYAKEWGIPVGSPFYLRGEFWEDIPKKEKLEEFRDILPSEEGGTLEPVSSKAKPTYAEEEMMGGPRMNWRGEYYYEGDPRKDSMNYDSGTFPMGFARKPFGSDMNVKKSWGAVLIRKRDERQGFVGRKPKREKGAKARKDHKERSRKWRPSTGEFKRPPGGMTPSSATSRRAKARMRGIKGGKKTGLSRAHLAVEMSHRGVKTKQPMSKDPRKYRQYLGQQEARKRLGNIRTVAATPARYGARSYRAGRTGGGTLQSLLPGQAAAMRRPALRAIRPPPLMPPRMPSVPSVPGLTPPSIPSMGGQGAVGVQGPKLPTATVQGGPSMVMTGEVGSGSDLQKRGLSYYDTAELRQLVNEARRALKRKETKKKGKGTPDTSGAGSNLPKHPENGPKQTTRPEGATEDANNEPRTFGMDPIGHIVGRGGRTP